MQALAAKLKGEQSLLVFGRGFNYATALEAALKVRCSPLLGNAVAGGPAWRQEHHPARGGAQRRTAAGALLNPRIAVATVATVLMQPARVQAAQLPLD